MDFMEKLFEIDVVPNFDCNVMPKCYWNFKDLYRFRRFLKNKDLVNNVRKSGLLKCCSFCVPIIDIYPDLTVSRCLSLSKFTRRKMSDFRGVPELIDYYKKYCDNNQQNYMLRDECADCSLHKDNQCFGGCLGYKIKNIINEKNSGV